MFGWSLLGLLSSRLGCSPEGELGALGWGLVSSESRESLLIEWDRDGSGHGRWCAELLISLLGCLLWPVLPLTCLNALVLKAQDDEKRPS